MEGSSDWHQRHKAQVAVLVIYHLFGGMIGSHDQFSGSLGTWNIQLWRLPGRKSGLNQRELGSFVHPHCFCFCLDSLSPSSSGLALNVCPFSSSINAARQSPTWSHYALLAGILVHYLASFFPYHLSPLFTFPASTSSPSVHAIVLTLLALSVVSRLSSIIILHKSAV